ncbi:relaxase domain-containing protein [Phormidium tenue FACHB-886]|nr:relaxase domain-containing protein [Phormidium tenue FACHB-886]
MLARPANLTAKQAAHYYEKDDYYDREKESQFACYWYGKGAEKLELNGTIDSQNFQRLLKGYSPAGRRLHAKPIDPEIHRAATDYTFSAPKSVSVAALVQQDYRLIEAHDRAVQSSLKVIEERYIQARAWNAEARQQDKVFTGNLVAANYRHETSRNLDPQLHTHCVVINATQDGRRWKAVSNELAVKNQKLLGQIYQNDLAYQARHLGYETEPRAHGQFELKGYPLETLKAFSSRRQEIEERIAQSGEVESVRSFQRAAIQTRSQKTVLSQDEKRKRWDSTINQHQLQFPPVPESGEPVSTKAESLVQQHLERLAEQEGAFRQEQLEQQILESALGECRFSEIEAAIDHCPELVWYGTRLTTHDRLDRLTQLEQLLGLENAQNQTRETEQAGRTAEADSGRDSGRAIGISIAERLAATLPAIGHTRRNAEQVDRCLEQINNASAKPGIDFAAVSRGIAAIRDREAFKWAGEEIAATLESVSNHLTEFEGVSQQLNQFIEGYRDRLAARETERRHLPGSAEWSHTEFVLSYCESRLRQSKQVRIENKQYWAERNPAANEVLVGRKADSQVIAQGKLTASGWNISEATVELSDWTAFIESQQRQQQRELEHQQAKRQKAINDRKHSQKQDLER